jgi:hypothetical protein
LTSNSTGADICPQTCAANGVVNPCLSGRRLQESGMQQFHQGNYAAHPNFIRLNDIAEFNGRRIALRIDNTTEFVPAAPAMNDFNGLNFQINLAPIYDIGATDPSAFQPFMADSTDPIGQAMNHFIGSALDIDLRAQNANNVALFFSFFDQNTGEPVELEEVSCTPSPCRCSAVWSP